MGAVGPSPTQVVSVWTMVWATSPCDKGRYHCPSVPAFQVELYSQTPWHIRIIQGAIKNLNDEVTLQTN